MNEHGLFVSSCLIVGACSGRRFGSFGYSCFSAELGSKIPEIFVTDGWSGVQYGKIGKVIFFSE